MANIINVLVLIVTYMFVVSCHMDEDSGMKREGTGNHMDMTGGNNGTEGTHGTGRTHGGTMKMFFNLGKDTTIVFKQWETDEVWALVVSCIAVAIISLLYEGLKVLRDWLGKRSKKTARAVMYPYKSNSTNGHTAEEIEKCHPSMLTCNHFVQTMLHMIQVFVGYFLMFAFMTFNAWLCISIVVGSGIGYFLFGWIMPNSRSGNHCN